MSQGDVGACIDGAEAFVAPPSDGRALADELRADYGNARRLIEPDELIAHRLGGQIRIGKADLAACERISRPSGSGPAP